MEIVGVQWLREWSLLDAGGCSDQDLVNAVAAVVQAEGVLAGVRLRLVAEVDAASWRRCWGRRRRRRG